MSNKVAVVFCGPGFSDQGDVIENLRMKGFRVDLVPVGFGEGEIPVPASLPLAQVVLLRGPWSASPEDRMMARLLALRMKPVMSLLLSETPSPRKVFALGRGALILLESNEWRALMDEPVLWKDWANRSGPWAQVQTLPQHHSVQALVWGRAVPTFSGKLKSQLVPWLRKDDEVVGWRTATGVCLSMLDVLAYAERSQMDDFGYRDLLRYPVQAEVLDGLLTGQWPERDESK
jgi:hypothetical protein